MRERSKRNGEGAKHELDQKHGERERPREQSERTREREVERQRFVVRAIPGRLSLVCLD